MSKTETKPVTQKALLAAIRSAVKKGGGKRIGMGAFFKQSGIRHSQFYKHFVGWNEALTAAGFDFNPHGELLRPERLLADWGSVARKVGGIPQVVAYLMHGKFSARPFRKRYGIWTAVPRAFRSFAKGKPEWADVLAYCDAHLKARLPCPPRRMRTHPSSSLLNTPSFPDPTVSPSSFRLHPSSLLSPPLPGRRVYGDPLQLPGLAAAPVNEAGVIYLFGILAWRLGFQVESLRVAFPDCEARRRMSTGQWQRFRIEFEYESRNFHDHGHNPKACDLIVCWEHNWPDCPKNLEVIALKDELERLERAYYSEAGNC